MILGLEAFGKVEQCEQIGEEYHIKITDGFDRHMKNTMDCIQLVLNDVPQFPIVVKCKTDTDIFHLILKR